MKTGKDIEWMKKAAKISGRLRYCFEKKSRSNYCCGQSDSRRKIITFPGTKVKLDSDVRVDGKKIER